MSTFSLLLGYNFAVMLLTLILYVVFGQVTVRKLRKNPETNRELGMEFVSGWDILNVAQALATPKKIHRILEKGNFSFLHANSEIIQKNTNKFDKILANIFFWPFMASGICMITLIILEKIGLFQS